MTISNKALRPIRSYVLRQGRMSEAQLKARNVYWPEFGLNSQDLPKPVEGEKIFARQAPRVLEIGFGMGDALIALAKGHPEMDFIGIEVHAPGVGRCLLQAKAHCLANLKLFNEDAVLVLEHFANSSFDKILLLFPDPWPKKKHQKRRLVQENFVSLVANKLTQGGQFHLATDWQPYADHMLAVLEASPLLANQFGKGHFAPPQYERSATKFEIRGKKLGHRIWDLVYFRN